MFVRLSGLSFSYIDSVSTLDDVTLTLATGWTGVVGPNGAGKTTLLRLIAGDLEPSAGHVNLDPPRGVIRACAQTVEAMTPEIAAFARATDGVARRIHGELRLDARSLARWPTLSPGERKRWQVGAALGAEPAVLMLDEPTDHLDVEARDLLIAGLERFRGVGIIVSHDRALLDRITSYTVRVHDGAARIWRGGYSDAKCAWEAEERERYAEYERLKHQRENLARRLADKRRLAMSAEAEANAGTRKRMKFRGDHDATSMFAKGKARMASRENLARRGGAARERRSRVGQTRRVQVPQSEGALDFRRLRACARRQGLHARRGRDMRRRRANARRRSSRGAARCENSRRRPQRHRQEHAARRDDSRRACRAGANPLPAAGTHRARRYRDARRGPRSQRRRTRRACSLSSRRSASIPTACSNPPRQVPARRASSRWPTASDARSGRWSSTSRPIISTCRQSNGWRKRSSSIPGAMVIVTHDDALAEKCTSIEGARSRIGTVGVQSTLLLYWRRKFHPKGTHYAGYLRPMRK